MITGDKGDKGDDDCCAGCPKWDEWTPDPSTVCEGEQFTQYRYDLCTVNYEEQNATGTRIPIWTEWTPEPSTVCEGEQFTQNRSSDCGGYEEQNATGTRDSNWSDWYPDVSDVCVGEVFTQERYDLCTGNYETKTAEGTKITNWSEWSPDRSTVCAGLTFNQSRYDLNNCTSTVEYQEAIGTNENAINGVEIVNFAVTGGTMSKNRHPGCGGRIVDVFNYWVPNPMNASVGTMYHQVLYTCDNWQCDGVIPCNTFIIDGIMELGAGVYLDQNNNVIVGFSDNHGYVEETINLGTLPTGTATYTVQIPFIHSLYEEESGNFTATVTYRTKCG